MKIYRVYGSCSDWECACEKTIKAFTSKEDAHRFEDDLSVKDIMHLCEFCTGRREYTGQIYEKGTIITDIEEIEVE